MRLRGCITRAGQVSKSYIWLVYVTLSVTTVVMSKSVVVLSISGMKVTTMSYKNIFTYYTIHYYTWYFFFVLFLCLTVTTLKKCISPTPSGLSIPPKYHPWTSSVSSLGTSILSSRKGSLLWRLRFRILSKYKFRNESLPILKSSTPVFQSFIISQKSCIRVLWVLEKIFFERLKKKFKKEEISVLNGTLTIFVLKQ